MTKICPSQVRPSAESLEAKIGEVYLRETASNQTFNQTFNQTCPGLVELRFCALKTEPDRTNGPVQPIFMGFWPILMVFRVFQSDFEQFLGYFQGFNIFTLYILLFLVSYFWSPFGYLLVTFYFIFSRVRILFFSQNFLILSCSKVFSPQ